MHFFKRGITLRGGLPEPSAAVLDVDWLAPEDHRYKEDEGCSGTNSKIGKPYNASEGNTAQTVSVDVTGQIPPAKVSSSTG